MTSIRRNRKKLWKSILTALTLGTTLPALAFLCRGHSPSRFAVDNLPVWERITPKPASLLGRPVNEPLPSSDLHFASLPMASALEDADENTMFSTIELVKRIPGDRLAAGKPGVWLEQAAVLCHWRPGLLPKMDRVAVRLMNAEDNNGYLGALAPARIYTARDIAAHANNLRGLLAYYNVSRQPAALYAAMRAGNFLIDNYDPWPGNEEPGAEDSLVYALTRLYQACGDKKYLQFAEREEATRGCDGLGLCALYEATGNRRYLKDAVTTWSYSPRPHTASTTATASNATAFATTATGRARHEAGPQFSAELFTLTGNPKFLAPLGDCRTTSVWPVAVAYTRSSAGLSVNFLYPSLVKNGAIRVEVNSSVHAATAQEATATDKASPERNSVELATNTSTRNVTATPNLVETDVIAVSTTAHTAPLIHIALQPGCIASTNGIPVELSINGKRVNVDSLAGAHLALRPTDSNVARKPNPQRRHGAHPVETARPLSPEA